MYQNDLLEPLHCRNVPIEIVHVRMPRVRVDGNDFRLLLVHLIEDLDRTDRRIDHASAEGVLGHIANRENRILGILDLVFEVMADAAGFAHTRRRHDDHGAGRPIELLALLDGVGVADEGELERVVLLAQELREHLLIVALRVLHEHVGDARGKR